MATPHPLASLGLWHEAGGSFTCGEADDLARVIAESSLDAAACVIAGHVDRDDAREDDDPTHLHVAAGGVIDSPERMARARAHVDTLIGRT